TALALLSYRGRGLVHEELLLRCQHLLDVCVRERARLSPALVTNTGQLRAVAIREALQMFVDARYVDSFPLGGSEPKPERAKGERRVSPNSAYSVVEERRLALDTSKNVLIHFFVERALVAASLSRNANLATPTAWVKYRVRRASKLFKHEFRFKADAAFDRIFADTLETLRAENLLLDRDGTLVAGPGARQWDAVQWLDTFSCILQNFFEGYRIAARGLSALLGGPLAEKDLLKRSLGTGHSMYLAGEIHCREAVSKPLLQNAHLALIDFGYVRSRGGK